MSCTHPLLAKFVGFADGKPQYNVQAHGCTSAVYPDINIPCGHCIGCRLDKSRQWADRMMIELDHSKTAVFLTLTYAPEHVPVASVLDDGTVLYTLDKRDVQLFIKRLRRHFDGREIRYYLAGEYGDKTHRPHYHAIVFGLDLSDFPGLRVVGSNSFGQFLYTSPLLEDKWSLGNVAIASVSWQTCAYVARYCTKKVTGKASADVYDKFNVLPEFSLMSRRPGIGGFFPIEHPDLIARNKQYFNDDNGVTPRTSCQTPKYIFEKLSLTNPELYDILKVQRARYARNKALLELSHTDLDFYEYNQVKEFQNDEKLHALTRKI